MKWYTRIFWLIMFIAVVAGGYFAFRPQPVDVEVARVIRGPLEVTINEDGKTRIKEKYTVSTPVGGRLQRIKLHEGDPVSIGQTVLAEILPANPGMLDARSLAQAKAQVSAAKAAIERAEARTKQLEIEERQAKRNYERARNLVESRAISSSQYEETQADYRAKSEALRSARFDEDIANYELQLAEAALLHVDPDSEMVETSYENGVPQNDRPETDSYFSIHSPINGVVLRVIEESSTIVSPGMEIMEIGDSNDLEVVVDLLTTDAVKIGAGTKAYLEQWGGDVKLHGVVRLIEPAAVEKISALGVEEQRVDVIIDFASKNPDDAQANDEFNKGVEKLGDGYRIDARLVVWESQDVLQIPTSALFRHKNQWAVFVVRDEAAQLTPIKVGHRNEQAAEVLEGLKPDELVVLHPGDNLTDGAAVNAAE